ncbi:MAG: hypothetical protein F6K41_05130 [Symploca sp. SIO3E6]|nr:hypothetical protein [Caldora sp. SIO3E6]
MPVACCLPSQVSFRLGARSELYQIRYRYTRYAQIVGTFHETSLQGFHGLLKTALPHSA